MVNLFGRRDDFINQVTLFSERPENRALAAQVKAVAGPAADFATDFFAGAPEQGTTTAIRHQAEYDSEEKAWHLVEMKRYDGGAFNNMFTPATVGKTQNIFDALHWCSEFQAFAEQNSDLRIANPGKEYSCGFQHWRDVAKDMKLPIAENGVLVLPQKGRVLPDGHYKGDQVAAAYEAPRPVAAKAASPALLNEIDTRDIYHNAIAQGRELKTSIDIMEIRSFQTDRSKTTFSEAFAAWYGVALGILPTVAFSSLIPVAVGFVLPPVIMESVGYIKGNLKMFPERCLSKRCNEFNKAAARLPDERDRALCAEFTRQAAFKFWAGRAQFFYEKQSGSGKPLKGGLSLIRKAGESLGLDAAGIEKLGDVWVRTGFRAKSASEILKIAGHAEIEWSQVKEPP